MSQDLIPNFIEGEWTKATATETLLVKDPASGELLGKVPLSARTDVDRAVQAAAKAFPAWPGLFNFPPPRPPYCHD